MIFNSSILTFLKRIYKYNLNQTSLRSRKTIFFSMQTNVIISTEVERTTWNQHKCISRWCNTIYVLQSSNEYNAILIEKNRRILDTRAPTFYANIWKQDTYVKCKQFIRSYVGTDFLRHFFILIINSYVWANILNKRNTIYKKIKTYNPKIFP